MHDSEVVMAKALLSKKKADAVSNGIFLACLGILFYTNTWWPGILLAVWALLASRQFLTGRRYDILISSVILLGLFLVALLRINWDMLLPILFVVGGLYIIFREYFYGDNTIKDDIEDAK